MPATQPGFDRGAAGPPSESQTTPIDRVSSLIDQLAPLSPYSAPGRCAFAEGAVDGIWRSLYSSMIARRELPSSRVTDLALLSFNSFPPIPVVMVCMRFSLAVDMTPRRPVYVSKN